jgi:predicted nucleic acid-binding Zn ribbon protein
MPKYTYHCSKCESSYTISHSLNEIHDVCRTCGGNKCLNKIPTSFNYSKKVKKDSKTGTLVKDAIEDSKRDVLEAQESLRSRKYER